MKLYEYLQKTRDWETTVFDKDYDVETYFYKENSTVWDKAMNNLAKLLTISSFGKDGLIVNLSEVIKKKMSVLEQTDLFHTYDIELIMYDINAILAGNVSAEWLAEFVDALSQ